MSVLLSIIAAAAAALPPAPADGVLDEARVFSEANQATLAAEMRAFTERTGILVFVDTNTFLPAGVTAADQARNLLRAWSNHRPAVIVCLDRSAVSPPAVQVSDAIWERFTEPELIGLMRDAAVEARTGSSDQSALAAGVRRLITGFDAMETQADRRAKLLHQSDMKLMSVFLALLAVGAVLTKIVVRIVDRRDSARALRFTFPEANVAQRLGAPCGGGAMAEIVYRRE